MLSVWSFILLFATIFYFFFYEFYQKRKNLPPGPTPLPLIGNLLQINPKASHKTLYDWGKKYGSVFTVWFGPSPQIMINDFKLIKECLITNGNNFAGRPRHYVFGPVMRKGYKYGVAFGDGPQFMEQRRFSLHVLRDFGFGRNIMEVRIMEETDQLCSSFRKMVGDSGKKVLSIAKPMELCVGNIISSVLFGHDFHGDPEKFFQLQHLLDVAVAEVSNPLLQLVAEYPWLRHIPLFGSQGYPFRYVVRLTFCFVGSDAVMDNAKCSKFVFLLSGRFGYTKFNSVIGEYHEFLDQEISEHSKSFQPIGEPSDFVTAYMQELHRRKNSGEDMGLFGDWQLRMAVGDLWLAGLETSIKTLKWAILYMIHWPEMQEKCRKEIQEVLSRRADQEIHGTDKLKMVYTQACMQETQRLANIIPVNVPHKNFEAADVGGYHLAKGSYILPQISAVMMDPEIFPEPEKFKPERFLSEDGKSMKKVDELVPFSLGKRACLGESLAKAEMFLIFANLLKKFKFSAVPGAPLPTLETEISFVYAPKPYDVLVEVV